MILGTVGCSAGPSRIHPIGIAPDELSEKVIERFDTNGDGALTSAELVDLSPVHQNISAYDSDGNGLVSAAELGSRFREIFHHEVGVIPASCRVTQNGRPIRGAKVRFVPPPILEGVLPPAGGVTGSDGVAGLRLAPEDMPENMPNVRAAVMRPGIYLVEVTHPTLKIPPQYNTQTTLGKEVFSEVLNGPPLPITLKF